MPLTAELGGLTAERGGGNLWWWLSGKETLGGLLKSELMCIR